MRFLGVGSCADLGDVYLSLLREGREVRVAADDPAWRGPSPATGQMAGFLDADTLRHEDAAPHLPWVGRGGCVVVEHADRGAWQDSLRADGYRVVGGSALGDRLEDDRAAGMAALREVGLPTAPLRSFATPRDAAAWLARHPGRHVLKHDASAAPTFVGEHPEGADVLYMLIRRSPPDGAVSLMERLDGVEVGVGAWFDGRRFLAPPNLDVEHKRLFPGDLGEMTTEMGTLAAYGDAARPLFDATLARLAPVLARGRHVGYVNLNLIVDARGPWPLELTCRFGYPGHLVLAALQPGGWGDLFGRLLSGEPSFPAAPGWSVGVVLTVPPFPSYGPQDGDPDDDPPLFFRDPPRDAADAAHYRWWDARRDAHGQMYARRRQGAPLVVTGTGPTVEAARDAALARARNVVCPDLRWRADIGGRFLADGRARLRAWGWLPT